MNFIKKIPKKLLIFLATIFLVFLSASLIFLFLLITRNLLIFLPYNQNETRVVLNKESFKEGLKIAGIDSLIIKPSIIVRISKNTPKLEELTRYQRTASGTDGQVPSLGCNHTYLPFTLRIIIFNIYVRGDEYLERISEEQNRLDLLNRASMACITDLFKSIDKLNPTEAENLMKRFDTYRYENANIFDFKYY